ncbi:hypothetical protein L1987_37431 [Smallanthus sonchifolius]|uniref:Uncharacterized protein n=1 Tax=Smallanthus sonchifolius TaxID=185202 RepID=A0ACB9HGS2_9ASTR|nr:hypothetical protein L1987_37431 [Smallanthus sonchifolius]
MKKSLNQTRKHGIDWCSYTLECLKRTKSKWSGSEYCNAPITFFTMKKGNLCLEHYQQYNTKIQTVSLNCKLI